MRLLPLGSLAAVAVLAACGLPKTVSPRLVVSPYYAAYQMRGRLGMQSDSGSGPVDNNPQSLRNLGQDHYEDDYGIRVDVGDGMTGLRVEWYRASMSPTSTGVLDDDFGHLLANDVVQSNVRMNEYRVGYLQQVWEAHGALYDRPLDLAFAAGGILAHRDLELHARSTDLARHQDIDISDHGVVYPALRFRAGWQSLALVLEYAMSPDLSFGGDFQGLQQDVEARLTYTVPFQDIGLFVGYRYSTMSVEGVEGGLGFDGHLYLDGIQLGVTVSF